MGSGMRICVARSWGDLGGDQGSNQLAPVVSDLDLDYESCTPAVDDLRLRRQGALAGVADKVDRELDREGEQLGLELPGGVGFPHGGGRGRLVGEGDDGAGVKAPGELGQLGLEGQLRPGLPLAGADKAGAVGADHGAAGPLVQLLGKGAGIELLSAHPSEGDSAPLLSGTRERRRALTTAKPLLCGTHGFLTRVW